MALTRPLGREYRGDLRKGTVVTAAPAELPPFDPEPLRRAVAIKVAKHYQGVVHLFVYMNFNGENAREADVLAAVRDGGGDRFESVWLLAYAQEAGSMGTLTYHIRCAKASTVLVELPGWLSIPATARRGL